MKQESIAVQSLVNDAVSAAGGVAKAGVTDKMVDMVRDAIIRCKNELERKREHGGASKDSEQRS